MATRRLAMFLAGALAIGMGSAWVASDFRPVPPACPTCRVDVAYAVDVREDQATFDLPFEANTRYRLIIGSVTGHEVESPMQLSAERVPSVERFPLRQVPPIQSAIPEPFQTTWQNQSASSVNTAPSVSPKRQSPTERTFFLHVTEGPLDDPRQYVQVTGRPVAEGRFVRVFLDAHMTKSQLASGLVSEIVRLFDEQIVPGSRKVLGTFRDVDGDGKFAILISPWLGKLQGGKTAVGGFVRGSDFQQSVNPPFGNRADVMYLSTNLRPGPHLETLLAHEFAHALCFSERLPTKLHPQGLPTEEDWLNEAIAHLAENLHGTGWSNLDYRISRFLDETHHSPLVVQNYYANGLWRDPGCRGATYLFLRWVVDRFGPEILFQLIHNPNRGVRNLETATGVSFADLFRGWTIALAQNFRQETKTAASPGQFHSLDLQGRVGRWGLQGTRATIWKLEGEDPTFSLRGTTAKVFEVHANTPGVYRLRVRTQGQPNLQVTVIRQAAWGSLRKASAKWRFSESQSHRSLPALEVQLSAAEKSPGKIVRLSVECRQGKHHQSACFEGEQIALHHPSGETDSLQTLTLSLPERLRPSHQATAAEWQLKLLAEDARGRRSAWWIDLPAPPKPDDTKPIPVAAKSAREPR